MNWPSDSRNAIRTPLSPLTFGSRGPSLLVPTRTMPPATTGLPYACEPSSATHFTFFFVLTSQVVGRPFIVDTMLRSGVPPHIGQSPDPGSETANASEPTTSTKLVIANKLFCIGVFGMYRCRRRSPGSRTTDPGCLLIFIDFYIVVIDFRPAACGGWRVRI